MEICPFISNCERRFDCDNRCALLTPEGCSFRVIAEALHNKDFKK